MTACSFVTSSVILTADLIGHLLVNTPSQGLFYHKSVGSTIFHREGKFAWHYPNLLLLFLPPQISAVDHSTLSQTQRLAPASPLLEAPQASLLLPLPRRGCKGCRYISSCPASLPHAPSWPYVATSSEGSISGAICGSRSAKARSRPKQPASIISP